jgi:hypothetical protein
MDYPQALKIMAAAPVDSWYYREALRVVQAHEGRRGKPGVLGIDSGLGYAELNDDDGDGL